MENQDLKKIKIKDLQGTEKKMYIASYVLYGFSDLVLIIYVILRKFGMLNSFPLSFHVLVLFVIAVIPYCVGMVLTLVVAKKENTILANTNFRHNTKATMLEILNNNGIIKIVIIIKTMRCLSRFCTINVFLSSCKS